MVKSKANPDLINLLGSVFLLIGLVCASYLAIARYMDASPLCAGNGCTGWYVDGPFSHLFGVSLPILGVMVWLIESLLVARGGAYSNWAKWLGGIVAGGTSLLLVIGVSVTHTICIWCLVHCAACLGFVGALWVNRANTAMNVFPAAAFALMFGTGLAVVTPTERSESPEETQALSQVNLQTLESASEEVMGSGADTIIAIVDLNCGHCDRWLQECASSKQPTRARLRVLWLLTAPTGGMIDNNAMADSIAGDQKALRKYFASGCRADLAKGNRQALSRREEARALYQRLSLHSSPHFLLFKGSERSVVGPSQAYEALFH